MTDPVRRLLALSDLAAIQSVSDPRISPDGRRVAFVVETLDLGANQARERIWLAEVDGAAEPRSLTTGEDRESEPRWSPDGRELAYVSHRGGTRQIWLRSLDGAAPRPLTSHPTDAREPVWSPDGHRLAFVALGPDRKGDAMAAPEKDDRKRVVAVREHRHKLDGAGFFGPLRAHVWIVPRDGGAARQVTDGPYDDRSPSWSPDGRRIAVVSDRSADRDRHFGGGVVHVVDLETGELRPVTPEGGRAEHPSWSPDGSQIAYPGSVGPDEASPADTHLWVVGADGEGARCLTEGLTAGVGQRPSGYLTPSPPVWSPDGASILYLAGEGPSTHLARVVEGETTPLTSGRLVVHTFSADRAARRVALLVSDPVKPAEVWLWDGDAPPSSPRPAPTARPLTRLNGGLLAKRALAHPEDLRLTRPDGTVLQGWLLRPPAPTGEKLPLVLVVHGGPHNYFGDTFTFDHQLFAARGYAVLYVNPRGSGGYGQDFARAVCEDWGGEDFRDLMAFLDHVIARGDPPIDETRLAITGSSYGGFMTCWAITQTDRFATAVSGACISNLVSFFGTSDVGASWGARQFGGAPAERLDWYLARSSVLHLASVKTPLLLYHGESDLRCPIEQSEQMFSGLRHLGKTVEFLRVPTESHGVLSGSPIHRVVVRESILDWLARYLERR